MEAKRAAGKQVLDDKKALREEAKLVKKLRKLATYQEKISSMKSQKHSSKTVLNEASGSDKDLPDIPVTPLSARNSVWARKNRVKKGLMIEKQQPFQPVATQQPLARRQSNMDTTTKGPANALEEIECSFTNLISCNRTQEWFKYSSPGRTIFWQIFGVSIYFVAFIQCSNI